MKKLKYLLLLASFLLIFPVAASQSFFTMNLQADEVTFQAPIYSLYDKIVLGNQTFTVTNIDHGIEALSDELEASDKTWKEANDYLLVPDNFSSNYGSSAYHIVKNNLTLSSSSNLIHVKENDDNLSTDIPKVTSNWWLADSDVENNRSKFISGDNELQAEAPNPINYAEQNQETGACTYNTRIETGHMPTETKQDEQLSVNIPQQAYQGNYYVTGAGGSYDYYRLNFCSIASTNVNDCKNNDIGSVASFDLYTIQKQGSSSTKYFSIPKNDAENKKTKDVAFAYAMAWGVDFAKGISPGYIQDDYKKDISTDISAYCVEGGCEYGNIKGIKSVYHIGYPNLYGTIRWIVQDVKLVKDKPLVINCKKITNNAGTASLRPFLKLENKQILLGNSAKRNLVITTSLTSPQPTSDTGVGKEDKQFLTLLNSALDVSLTPGENVVGESITVQKNAMGEIEIPVSIAGEMEGTSYVSAVASNNDQAQVYGVLGEIQNNEAVLRIDPANLLPNETGTFTLTLYVEDQGFASTSFMSEGKQIKVTIPHDQEIEIDGPVVSEVAYGESISLQAHLVGSDKTLQSSEPILFSIVGDASITQEYHHDTGIATAKITPNSGSGEFKVLVDKDGDANYNPALQKTTAPITMKKKSVTFTPEQPTQIYRIGDELPEFLVNENGIINDDLLKHKLSVEVELEKLDEFTPPSPTSDGTTIDQAGTWKLMLTDASLKGSSADISDFKNKYDIIWNDYDQDHKLVFETMDSVIEASSVVITPASPNKNGWYKEDVVITLSQESIDSGFTTIILYEDSNGVKEIRSGESIRYTENTANETPYIRLQKGNVKSDVLRLNTIKIDKEEPKVEASVEQAQIWTSTSKKVSITASDLPMDGGSEIDSVEVDGGSVTVTKDSLLDVWTFQAEEAKIYDIHVSDKAGNIKNDKQIVEKIDLVKPTVNATLVDFASENHRVQDITLKRSVGSSGVKTYEVYYKQNASDPYVILSPGLDLDSDTLTYKAKMNGFFQFKLVNNANVEVLSNEIHVQDINPPSPVTQIHAVLDDDTQTPYGNGTWTNNDVILTLSNANALVSNVTWEVEINQDGNWKAVNGNTYKVREEDWLNNTYAFKGTGGNVDEVEPSDGATSIQVKIDKQKPAAPIIDDVDLYTSEHWYKDAVSITASPKEKPSGIAQTIYYRLGETGSWNIMSGNTLVMQENGEHKIFFKSIDELGNEGVISPSIQVNINKNKPVITFELNNRRLDEILNQITFGYFFKETVQVDIRADFGEHGDIYYIVDESDTPTMPEENDDRWQKERTTKIEPDKKAMLYAKAVSKAGLTEISSTVYHVYADKTDPNISLPNPDLSWSKKQKVEGSISDELSGIDKQSVTYQINSGVKSKLTVNNGKFVIQPLENGEYDISVHGNDVSGNEKESITHVKVDNEAPSIGEPRPQHSDWARKRTIRFSASDEHSGIDLDYPKVTSKKEGSKAVIKDGDGSYHFEVSANDVYTITIMDQAGNETSKEYMESKIDDMDPVISEIEVEDPDIWTGSKKVHFSAVDKESGVDKIIVSYVFNGKEEFVNVTSVETNKYSFTANEASLYTIKVVDFMGNEASDTILVEHIDKEKMAITNISNINTWVKDEMAVSFHVQSGESGLKDGYPKVLLNGTECVVTKLEDEYAFKAMENETYVIQAMNPIGDKAEESITINKIDTLPPVISNVSNNTTSEEYREPQTITFNVTDFNDSEHTLMGSGLKNGSPRVYYMEDENQRQVEVLQDRVEPSLYSFLADKNTTYVVEAIDDVEHDPVTMNIEVDHILDPNDIQEIQVVATNLNQVIASGTVVKGEVIFTLSGGLPTNIQSAYQVAITDGEQPRDDDWKSITHPSEKQHKMKDSQIHKSIYFRNVPVFAQAISKPFIVTIDNEAPTSVEIHVETKHTNPIARILNILSFGNWFNEEQAVTFTAQDNVSVAEDIVYMFAEETDGKIGEWQSDPGDLSYTNTDITIHAKAIDQVGNESREATPKRIQVDTSKPIIEGVVDKKSYKFYKQARTIHYVDEASGIDDAKSILVREGISSALNQDHKVTEEGIYRIEVYDNAGNVNVIDFTMVAFANIEEVIDGSDESKLIIEKMEAELNETKDSLDTDEIKDYEAWIKDALDRWNKLRKKVVENDDKSTIVEGLGDTSFDPKIKLVVDELDEADLPQLPRKAKQAYDVYLLKDEVLIQPNGDVKVSLPYTGEVEPIVYEIDNDDQVHELSTLWKEEKVVFETDVLMKYAISNIEEEEIIPDDDVDHDSDGDKKPDVNVDTTCDINTGGSSSDGKADINIDTNNDLIPDINIDTTGDGKPNYNIDLGNDNIPDVNVGPVRKPWTPNLCKTNECGKEFCTDTFYMPYMNIDVDHDGILDINIDVNQDRIPDLNLINLYEAEGTWKQGNCIADASGKYCLLPGVKALINIDVNQDNIPDINIDTDGDMKADINIDGNPNGELDPMDYNLTTKLETWKPLTIHTYEKFQYGTMGELRPYVNVLRIGDTLPSLNIDVGGIGEGSPLDGLPDINIDAFGGSNTNRIAALGSQADGIPETNIDGSGDGFANINLDPNKTGRPQSNIVEITNWNPTIEVKRNGMKYITMKVDYKERSELEDKGIIIEIPNGTFLPSFAFRVDDITSSITKDEKDNIQSNAKDQELKVVYKLQLLKDDVQVHPDGNLKVKIPILDGVVNANLLIQQVDGTYKFMKAVMEGKYYVYESDFLGNVSVIGNKETLPPPDPDDPKDDPKDEDKTENPDRGDGVTSKPDDYNISNGGFGGAGTGDGTIAYKFIMFTIISMITLCILFVKKRKLDDHHK